MRHYALGRAGAPEGRSPCSPGAPALGEGGGFGPGGGPPPSPSGRGGTEGGEGSGLKIILLLLALLLPLPTQAESPKDTAAWWIDQYGALDEDDPVARQAHEIFDRLRNAGSPNEPSRVRLTLLDTDERLSPLALPDGTVLVARSVLDLCYGKEGRLPKRDRRRDRGDARLALFLAHEMEHVFADDTERRAFADGRDLWAVKDNAETMADVQGMLTLWYAGYEPDLLFEKDRRFFHEWAAWMGHGEEPEPREKLLRERLQSVRGYVPYFHWGTRLLQLGRYEDGVQLLEHFQTQFESREVLSNLGYAQYQLASRHLAQCDGKLVTRYQLPARIDPETLAERSRRRGGAKSSDCFENRAYRQHMDDAKRLLETAKKQDPDHLPARLNLIAALLLDEEPAAAVGIANEARELAPDAPEVANGSALALYLFGRQSNVEDAAEQALERLSAAYEAYPEATYLLYNQARIHDDLKRTARAKELWLEFLAAESRGPWADVARERLGQPVRDVVPSKPSTVEEPPVSLGSSRKKLRDFDRYPLEHVFFQGASYQAGDVSAFEIDDTIEVVEKRLLEPIPLDDLLKLHGEPDRRRPIHGGEIVFYPGYALDVADGKVIAEIWFEPGRI